ncbi:MAG: hypothetical protein CVU84_08415 [Firmicutes bacterium HGW-Firmicutes-1]|jgi:flagellar hook-associated protein 2|nr:MAG: hypothetical protein CVU84_08415 [Firmicutes bacterium HGW-Firmicutes-1]
MAGMQISGLASGMDTDTIIKDLMKAQQNKIDKVNKQKMKVEMKKEVWEEMNTKLYSFYTKQVFDLKSAGTYKAKSATVSDETKLSVSASTSAAAGVHTFSVTQLAKSAHLYSNAISDDTVVTGEAMAFKMSDGTTTADINLASGATISDLVTAINGADLNITASYDSKNKRIFLNSTTMGDASTIKFENVDTALEGDFFKKIGFNVNTLNEIKDTEAIFYKDAGGTVATLTEYTAMDPATQALYTQFADLGAAGQKSTYEYNGVAFEGDSNTVTVNGLSLTFKAEVNDIKINVTDNKDAIYNRIKDFIKAYNTLIEEIATKLDANPNKYDPLTDVEKESLDDKTIENWENKVKEALLRRDDKLTSVSNFMRIIINASSGVDTSLLSDGFKFLSDVGITTGNYTEKGKLHIQGDSEDSLYSLNENKLKKAIDENPEKVAELFMAIGNELYSKMAEKMKSTSLNSAFTFYNDKQMKKQVVDYEDRMAKLEDKMITMETRYRAQFTAMEKAIQRANSQSTNITNMLSGS